MIPRILFFVMLAANLAVLTWIVRSTEPERPPLAETEPGIPPLVLLKELEHPRPVKANAPASARQVCYSLGPLPSESDARNVAAALAENVQEIRQRQTSQTRQRGFWVYLPAMQTRSDALSQARELSRQGIRDYYVVTTGDNENTISLGVYNERPNAERRQALIQSLGYDARLTERIEEIAEFWVDYAQDPNLGISWQPSIARFEDASRREISCF